MKYIATTVLLCLLSFSSVSAQEVKAPKFGKGIFNIVGQDSTWTMRFATRMQFLAIADWDSQGGDLVNPQSNALVRRARFKFDGFAFSPKLKYKFELGLSNRDIGGASPFTNNGPKYILDAVVKWNFYKNFTLWVGQTKLPGNVERVISSGNLQLVDRSLVNSRFNIDRDMGIQLRHHFNLSDKFLVRERVAISQGEGRNITVGNLGGHQFTGRLELLPFGKFTSKGEYSASDLKREQKPKLMLAATYDMNKDAVKTRSNLGSFMETDTGFFETDISTVFVDAVFKYKGFSFMGEYASRDADDPIARNSDGTLTGDIVQVGNGLNLQAGYLLKSNWEFAGRYTNIELDQNITGTGLENQYTFGVSKYIVGHKLKVQSDISYSDRENRSDKVMFRMQLDVHF